MRHKVLFLVEIEYSTPYTVPEEEDSKNSEVERRIRKQLDKSLTDMYDNSNNICNYNSFIISR